MWAAWSRDSIKVTEMITGTNYGRDRSIYTQKVPVEARIAIVSGDPANKMSTGKSMPYSEIRDAVPQQVLNQLTGAF